MSRRHLVTAALPYSNNRLHVGHLAGAYLPADTYVRFLRARGDEVLFVCGSDDNGVAIEIAALQEGSTPEAVSVHYHDRQALDFAGMEIEFDIYGGTHQPGFVELHERFSQDFFRRIHDQGYFTKRRTRQLYDPKAGRFLPDRFVRGRCYICGFERAAGDQCENCGNMIDALELKEPISVITGAPAEPRETTHWYLQLAGFEEPLRHWLQSKQGEWRPNVLNFALGQIRQGLPERAMTRDISWGVPVPLDDPDARGKVLYVWFDAPIGYMSFTAAWCAAHEGDWRAYERWWRDPATEIVHFIGEDNTVFHALTWPAMLMAEGRHQLPSVVVANNFLNQRVGGEPRKISKSTTPADAPVWLEEYLRKGLDPDALRYYLTAQAPETARTFFDPDELATRVNGELVGAFGNFVHRGLTFATRYFEGRVPAAAVRNEADQAHLSEGARALERVGGCLAEQRFRNGIEEMMAYARLCNEYFNKRAPWATRNTAPVECAATIATCLDSNHLLAIMAWPFLPRASRQILIQLGLPDEPPRWEVPPPMPAGQRLGQPAVLFAKVEGGST